MIALLAATVMICDEGTSPAAGRAIYHRGEGVSVWLNRGEFKVPAEQFACAGCHGPTGQGGSEAGVTVPPIHATALRQAQPPYDSARLHRAIASGIASGGRKLASNMPLYEMTSTQWASLEAYLRILGTNADTVRGVTDSEILIGAALPMSGSRAAVGRELQAVLARELDLVSGSNGIYGRRMRLIVEDSSGGLSAALLKLIGEHRVFVLAASDAVHNTDELRTWLESHDELMIAPLVFGNAGKAFSILPSVEEQSEVLADWAAETGGDWTIAGDDRDGPAARVFQRKLEARKVPGKSAPRLAYFGDTAGLARLIDANKDKPPIATLSTIAGHLAADPGVQSVAPLPGGFASFGARVAQVIAEAARRTGRKLHPAGFTAALESLELDGNPPVKFSKTDRQGVHGAYRITPAGPQFHLPQKSQQGDQNP